MILSFFISYPIFPNTDYNNTILGNVHDYYDPELDSGDDESEGYVDDEEEDTEEDEADKEKEESDDY